jgi:hypothetical protein
VIGDIIGSKAHRDRRVLQIHLRRALDDVNARVGALQRLEMTLGDEFQGLYASLAAAVQVTLLVRLCLVPRADVRFGIGWGPLYVYEPGEVPYGQDGPAWWEARRCIDAVAGAQRQRGSPRGLRTCFSSWQDGPRQPAREGVISRQASPGAGPARAGPARAGPEEGGASVQLTFPGMGPGLPAPALLPAIPDELVNAYLVCRDDLVGQMDDRDVRIVLALLDGRRQMDIATEEGVSASAIAQRLAKSGSYALLRSVGLIERTGTERTGPWHP